MLILARQGLQVKKSTLYYFALRKHNRTVPLAPIDYELGKGFSRPNLINMKKLYKNYPGGQTLSDHLNWSHYCELILVEDDDARGFYEKECQNSRWSVRELHRQIESALFQRLLLSDGTLNKQKVLELSKQGQIIEKPEDILKEPYVLEFLGIPENKPAKESDLEKKLLERIEDFLLELGRGFMFVGTQQRVTIGNVHHHVDMVFYNKLLKAYVLIDLKIGSLKLDNAGQMNRYVNRPLVICGLFPMIDPVERHYAFLPGVGSFWAERRRRCVYATHDIFSADKVDTVMCPYVGGI